jgi:hypothetical protein
MDLDNEPFIDNILQLFQCHKLRGVKNKARIHIKNGVQLIGVLDETGTLEYGQIFVQVRLKLGKLSESPYFHCLSVYSI